MYGQAWSDKELLEQWADKNTKHLDFVASWETLLSVYEGLQFKDNITDTDKMKEFKWIISETNKFLTRSAKGITSARDIESAIDYLGSQFNTKDTSTLMDRPRLAYNKLKQQWITQSISQLRSILDIILEHQTEEEEEDE